MIYKDRNWNADDYFMSKLLEWSGELGFLVCCHAENNDIVEGLALECEKENNLGMKGFIKSRPDYSEWEAISRAVDLAGVKKGSLYIVHISTGMGALRLAQAKSRGVRVYGETCPQYLALTSDILRQDNGNLYATCPPLRTQADNHMLIQSLMENQIHVIATDHAPFNSEQKNSWEGDFRKIPYGMAGTEMLLPVAYNALVVSGKMTISHMANLISTNPAKIFGLYPRKGSLIPGTDADITIFDPQVKQTVNRGILKTRTDICPYDGAEFFGRVTQTLLRGNLIYDGKNYLPVQGKFLVRNPV